MGMMNVLTKVTGSVFYRALAAIYRQFVNCAKAAMRFVMSVCSAVGVSNVLALSVVLFAASFVIAFKPGILGAVINHLGGAWLTAFAILLAALSGFLFAESYTILVSRRVETEIKKVADEAKRREADEQDKKKLQESVEAWRAKCEQLTKSNDTDRSQLLDVKNKCSQLEKSLADEKRRSLDVSRLDSILELTLMKVKTTVRDFCCEWLDDNVQREEVGGGGMFPIFGRHEPKVKYFRHRRLGYAEYDVCVKLGIDLKSLRFRNEADVIRVRWRKIEEASVGEFSLKRKMYAKEKVYLTRNADVDSYDPRDVNSFVLNEVVMSDENGSPQVDQDRHCILYESDPNCCGEVVFSKDDPAYKGWEKQCEEIKERVFALRGGEFKDAHERMSQLTQAYLNQFLAPIGKRVEFGEYELESDVAGFVTLDDLVLDFNKRNVDRLLDNA